MSDKDKRYPTRMHEVLGVESRERFTYSDYGDREFMLSESGLLYGAYDDGKVMSAATQGTLVLFINHPERIIRKPRLTEEQVAMLKAAWTLGARYITREGKSGLRLSDNAPLVLMGGRLSITDDSLTMYIESHSSPLAELVKQSDPDPLDIVATLRDAGCEIEGVE